MWLNNIQNHTADRGEYKITAYSKNVTPILNNGICDTYAAMLYSVPFRLVCRACIDFEWSFRFRKVIGSRRDSTDIFDSGSSFVRPINILTAGITFHNSLT